MNSKKIKYNQLVMTYNKRLLNCNKNTRNYNKKKLRQLIYSKKFKKTTKLYRNIISK